MLTFFACVACRLVSAVLKLFGKGATSLPGMIALKIYPSVLKKVSSDVKIVCVTGTNGKTTSCRIIEQGLIETGKSYFMNRSGANLITGVTTSFIMNSSIFGKCKKEYAILECDENAFKKISKYIDASVVLVTNVFRDQLDRYGEVTHTLSAIEESVSNMPDSVLCLNADCSLTYSISKKHNNKVYTYGVNSPFPGVNAQNSVSDAKYCIFCKNEYEYSFKTYGHLGGFKCPHCGYERKMPDVAIEQTVELKEDYSTVLINFFGEKDFVKINVPGTYNVYNAAGAALALSCLGIDKKIIFDSLSNFNCAFGRMEKFQYNSNTINMILVKNPAGFSQTVNHISASEKEFSAFFCLNDNAADGRDVSWIWDVEFDSLVQCSKLKNIYTCGKRAYDMALRLKYAGIDASRIKVIENEDYDKMIDFAISENREVYIVPTYTSMMELRHKVAKKFGGKEFWE